MKDQSAPKPFSPTVKDFERWNVLDQAERRLEASTVPITWALLVLLEPGLGTLLTDVQAIKDDHVSESFCANRHWYRHFKPRLLKLVGYERPDVHPILSSPVAYEIAYDQLLDPLPPCRNCACL